MDWNGMLRQVYNRQVLRQLRTVDPDCPFIMITGSADMDSVARARESGVTAYISKPFSAIQLEKKLRVIARLNKFGAGRSQASA